ncbi:MAG: hypothetical protein R8G66_30420 [Cytophagales bacterium]|nr:hypothetical protein [Cytophagales bacterium]
MVHLLRNGTFIAPFYVFIKCPESHTSGVLNALKLSEWKLSDGPLGQSFHKDHRHFYLARSKEWLHLMDDGYYTLWNDQNFRERIPKLSRHFPIFACWVGDTEDSFGFQLFLKEKLVREYIVEDPDFNRILTARYQGKRLSIEKRALKQKDAEDKIIAMAKGLGVNVEHNPDEIRAYFKKIGG